MPVRRDVKGWLSPQLTEYTAAQPAGGARMWSNRRDGVQIC